jgi:hypothetical protein
MAGWTSRCDTVRCPSRLEAGSPRERRSSACRCAVFGRAIGSMVGHRCSLLPHGRRPVRFGTSPRVPVRASCLGFACEARPGPVMRHLCLDHADRGVVCRVLATAEREGGKVSPRRINRPPRRLGSQLLHAMHKTRCSRFRPRACTRADHARALDIVRGMCRRLMDHDRRGCDQSRGPDRG